MGKFKDIYLAKVYYKGQEGHAKRRPVLIIDDSENNLVTIAEITSAEPNDPPKTYDVFKVEILDWKAAGLDKPSWVKCYKTNVHRVPKDRLIKFIGEADDLTILNVLEIISGD
ncbi:type II toxin-antitoxin system PemK/MazF family toxin [Sporosarcina sp. P17b]|uniref:type II toxin-antitoxin system PemK/MazF family toxin n=1 Tax=Sporosarcina sp. P17b TaxID=2048260 RepID=UPI000C3FD098|nr:type II toxin-antitoxin system PemK/MazF family toxin [Sporosarcina sp. P17b]PIC72911.1 hypothetical protein CSV76_12990 [Sporosarcina sp. P17b]